MARLPYVDAKTAPPPVRDALERLPVPLNIFRIMAHAETCFRPLLRLGAAVLGQQQLDAKLRELAILRVARLSRAPYEWGQHVPIARSTGVSAAQIEALERDALDAGCFDPLERLVLRFTDELVGDVRASDACFAEMQEQFSSREIVELILAVGYYMMIARLLESTAVDPDASAGTRILESAREGIR